jgi:acyl carrier protein
MPSATDYRKPWNGIWVIRAASRKQVPVFAAESRYNQRRYVREVRAMSARSTIVAEFERVAAERQRELAVLSDDLKLLDSGLDSLSFAVLVIRLEETLGVDPFNVEEVKFPVTFGDLVSLYESYPRNPAIR